MDCSRDGMVVRVSESGHAEDDTNIHEFTVVDDLREDSFDVLAAEEGYRPKANVTYRRSGTRDSIGIDWWQISEPPRRVVAHLESHGYIVL